MNTQLAVNHELYWQIMDTAQLFFLSKGFDHTTVEDITEFLNISEVQFLYFFPSLDEILELLWAGVLHEKLTE